jgi:hypothetical protein
MTLADRISVSFGAVWEQRLLSCRNIIKAYEERCGQYEEELRLYRTLRKVDEATEAVSTATFK